MELLKKLAEAHGVSGFEDKVSDLIIRELKPLVDDIKTDVMGNIIGVKKAKVKNPLRVMISAHMDEIGFMVKHIDDNGFIRFEPNGGFDPKTLIAHRVLVHGRKKRFDGVVGTKPIHLMSESERSKLPELKELFIDIGLTKKEVEKDIEIGDMISLVQNFVDHGKHVSCKAFDDRAGVYVMIEALRILKKHDVEIYAVASVQEEVGLRGAITAAYGVNPDIGIALDVTLACDIPGGSKEEEIASLGGGVAIKLKDSSLICNPKLVRFMRDIAKKYKIKNQLEILPRGGTDAGAIQRTHAGVAAITLSIPTRYVHSVVETANKDDIKATIELLAKFLENAHDAKFTNK